MQNSIWLCPQLATTIGQSRNNLSEHSLPPQRGLVFAVLFPEVATIAS